MHCGLVATVGEGRITRIEGDLDANTRGFICHHGYALRELVHSPLRVKQPLMRRSGELVPVSWGDALDLIAERLLRIREQHGPESLVLQTGWPFVRHPIIGLLHRFCEAFGTPNLVTVASLCEASERMGQALTIGSKARPDLPRCRSLTVWGANPPRSAPLFEQVVMAKAQTGNLVVVDPMKTALARAATLHLQVRPGSDGALALGMISVLIEERLYSETFVAEHTLGFEELAVLAREYPLDRVEALTSVPRSLVVQAVRRMAADGPTAFWSGLGVEHHRCGVQTVRAITSLEALLGHVDEPGGAVLLTPVGPRFAEEMLPALYRLRTPEPVPPPVKAKPVGYDEIPLFEVYNREAQGNLLARAIEEGRPYPIQALVMLASNPFVTGPGAPHLRRAAEKLALRVSIDPFLSGSGKLSDFVLPAATFMESPTVRGENGDVERGGVVALQHGAWPDWKILVELARRMGMGAYFPWDHLADALAAPAVPFKADPAHQPRPSLPAGAKARFPTPSGKIEFASALLRMAGQDPLPRWEPPEETPSEAFPLWLVTGPRGRAFINSQLHHLPSLEAKQLRPEIQLHPAAAAKAGVADGQKVNVVSPHGQLTLWARVREEVHPEAAVMPANFEDANANQLTTEAGCDPISGFPVFRSGVCRVEAVSSFTRKD
jgi:anaerobic selenocysteine-containing dehydrogenase